MSAHSFPVFALSQKNTAHTQPIANTVIITQAQNHFVICFDKSSFLLLKVNKDKCIGCGMCVSMCEEVYTFDDDNCLFHSFLCTTDCDKNNIKLQKGETISFKWISENEFIEFVNSDKMIDTQKRRYTNWLKEKGYLR